MEIGWLTWGLTEGVIVGIPSHGRRISSTVTFNEGETGRYCLRNDLADIVRGSGAVACKERGPEKGQSARPKRECQQRARN